MMIFKASITTIYKFMWLVMLVQLLARYPEVSSFCHSLSLISSPISPIFSSLIFFFQVLPDVHSCNEVKPWYPSSSLPLISAAYIFFWHRISEVHLRNFSIFSFFFFFLENKPLARFIKGAGNVQNALMFGKLFVCSYFCLLMFVYMLRTYYSLVVMRVSLSLWLWLCSYLSLCLW